MLEGSIGEGRTDRAQPNMINKVFDLPSQTPSVFSYSNMPLKIAYTKAGAYTSVSSQCISMLIVILNYELKAARCLR